MPRKRAHQTDQDQRALSLARRGHPRVCGSGILNAGIDTVVETPVRFGATREDWDHFGMFWLGLTADLLPVVSNPNAVISPLSKMRNLGKTPSEYTARRQVRGITAWPNKHSTDDDVVAWMAESDYGICIQTRSVRALDVDVDDVDEARAIQEAIAVELGIQLPVRWRENSAKFLQTFKLPGDVPKRRMVTAKGVIEFLGTGQQFVAVGTHPTGVRYQWKGGLPDSIPEVSLERFEALWSVLEQRFATEASVSGSTRPRLRGPALDIEDPLADFLRDTGLLLGKTHDGALIVECPWIDEHTSGDAGDGSSVYFPAGTNGYKRGKFHCKHSHCLGRKTAEFAESVGYDGPLAGGRTAEDDFGDLPNEDPPAPMTNTSSIANLDEDEVEPEEVRIFDPTNFPEIADSLWRKEFGGPATSTLRKWHGDWFAYSGKHYLEADPDALGVTVHRYLANSMRPAPRVPGQVVRDPPVPFRPQRRHIEETLVALRSLTLLQGDAPMWAPHKGREGALDRPPAEAIISLNNGLFHLPRRQLLPHTSSLFCLNTLPFDYDPRAECLEWNRFLDSVWGDDQDARDTLQEMLGYLLTSDISQHKIFYIVGAKRGGKGTIGKVVEGLLGSANVAGPSLSSLATQFGLATLIGKQVAIVGDARGGGHEIQVTVERLLMISGGDKMSIDRKNRTAWEGRLTSRMVLMSNELLVLPDASGALASRMLVLRLSKSFFGREDTTLGDRILQELPGIFIWALEGLDRLNRRGHFVQPESGRNELRQLEVLNSPVTSFVEAHCELGEGFSCAKDELYRQYQEFCIAEGRRAEAREVFLKSLYAAFTELTSARPREADGKRVTSVSGLRLLSPVKRGEF